MPVEFFQPRRKRRQKGALFAFQPQEVMMHETRTLPVSRVFVLRGNKQRRRDPKRMHTARRMLRSKFLDFLHSPFFRLRAGLLAHSTLFLILIVLGGLVFSSFRLMSARPKKLPSRPPMPVVQAEQLLGERVSLKPGESLANALYRTVKDPSGVASVVRIFSDFINLKYLRVGQVFDVGYVTINDKQYLRSVVMERGRVDRIVAFANKNGRFHGQQTKNFLKSELADVSGVIESSLYSDGLAAGAASNKLAQLFDVFAFTIDFQRDLHPGDTFRLIYETEKDSFGEVASVGSLLAARLTAAGREHTVFRYEDKNGKVGYYSETGKGIRKALLLMPVHGGRLTSTFGTRRNPVYGYTENHPALDFGAPIGTPVMAGGDGVIIHRGWDPNGYGNYLKIRHNNGYVTLYAHMSRIAHSSVKGASVRQGQTIGYVGSTGMSTGPHLHYEIHVNNRAMNPAVVVRSMNSSRNLKEEEMADFRRTIQPYLDKFREQ